MAEKKPKKATKKKATKEASKKTSRSTAKKSVRGRKPKAKKAPRRRVSTKKPTKRGRSKALKDEFIIPIHTVEADTIPEVDPDDADVLGSSLDHGHDFDTEARDFSVERDVKTVSGLEKREEHVTPREKVSLDLREKKKKQGRGWKVALIVLGVLLGIGAVAAIVYALVFARTDSFSGETTKLSVVSPDVATSGSEISYQVTLTNDERVAFNDIEFDFVYPEGFSVLSVDPKAANFNQTKWEVATLSPGEQAVVEVSGIIVGAKNEEKDLRVQARYMPENVSSPFTEEFTATTKIQPLETDFTITGPESVTSGEEFSFEIGVTNSTGSDLDNLRVRMQYPEGYSYKSSKPRPDFGEETFDLGAIEDDVQEKIEISGVLAGKTNERQTIVAELGFVNDKNEFIPQITEEYDVLIAEVIASVETLVSGKKRSSAFLGDVLEYEIVYKNEGTEAFNNVRIETKLDTSIVDQDSFEVADGVFENSVVSWTPDTLSALEVVNPGDEGRLSFKVKLSEQVSPKSAEDTNLELEAMSTFSAEGTQGDTNREVSIESNVASTRISSGVGLTVEPHYYDFEGQKVGSGPLPPVKGRETKYRLYLTLSNTFNEVNDTVVSLQASDNVSFSGEKSTDVGTLVVNAKTVTWNVGKIPAHTGRFKKNIEAYVDVVIKPSIGDVGRTPDILAAATVSSRDAFSEEILEPEITIPTTSLDDDAFATESGVVQELDTSTPADPFDDVTGSEASIPESEEEAGALR